jgi:hypothetical protein
MGFIYNVLWLALVVAALAGLWKIFEKAGKPGWAALVPFYNLIVLLEIVGKPITWFIFMLIPCVNFYFGVLLVIEVAKVFGKDVAFAIGLFLLPFVFYPILGFGDAKYAGASAS